MLFNVEGFQAECGDDEVGAVVSQAAVEDVILNEADLVRPVLVQAVDRPRMHAGGNVDGCDRADIREALQQVRPDLARAGHEVIACGEPRLRNG